MQQGVHIFVIDHVICSRHVLINAHNRELFFPSMVEKAGRHLELKANPYLPLVRILAAATQRDAVVNPDWVKPKKRVEVAMDKARQVYASRGVTAQDMTDMERILREKGLSTDHLHLALDERNEALLGLSANSSP